MLRFLVTGAALMVCVTAAAEDISYNYLSASYQRIDSDGDGFGVGASVEIGNDWFVSGGLSSSEFDFGNDVDQWSIGAGWHSAISQKSDFVAELAYVDVDAGGGSNNGIAASIGLRGMVRSNLELAAGVTHIELDDIDGETALNAAVWYTMSGNLALGFGVSFDDDATSYGVGVRLYFDK